MTIFGRMATVLSVALFLFSSACSQKPQDAAVSGGREVKGERYAVSMGFPQGWTADTGQDYCEIIAYGPEDTYAMLTVTPAKQINRYEHMVEILQMFSFFEDFRVMEDSEFKWGGAEGGSMIYTYRETSQNESFVEYAFYRQDEDYFYLVQLVAPAEIFGRYRDSFRDIALTLRTGN